MTDSIIHLRNGRAERRPHVMGEGVTWCGKKLLGKPESDDGMLATFSSYGNLIHASFDPEQGNCERCRDAFDAAYSAAFPDGLKPLATFRADNPSDMERAKALFSPDALNRFFGPGGGGLPALEAAIADNPSPTPTTETDNGE